MMINALLARSKFKQLLNLLGRERSALVNGPIDDLENIARQRDSLLESMVNGGPVARRVLEEGLPKIQERALRNTRLLKASIEGMRSARATISAIEANASRLKTYTSDGQMAPTTGGGGKPVKRV